MTKKKGVLIGIAAALFIAAFAFSYQYFSREYQIKTAESDNDSLRDLVVDDAIIEKNKNNAPTTDDDTEDSDQRSLGDSGAEYTEYLNPIDFDALLGENSDACAWVVIPDSEMSFPVVHREGDNTWYLKRDFYGRSSIYGAAYIEDYNDESFDDPATVIYGHDISNGEWFGELQTIFTDPARFEKCRDIKLYLPDEERTYRVFAAVPYGQQHILYYNDFADKGEYNKFIKTVTSTRSLNSAVDEDEIPTAGSRLLIFSTCLKGDYSHRFLVLAYQMQAIKFTERSN